METSQVQEQRSHNPMTRRLLAVVAGGAMLLTAGCSAETGDSHKPEVSVTSEYTVPNTEYTASSTSVEVTASPSEVVVVGDGNPANDSESSSMAKAYADNLDWEDSDAMQARIDDEVIAEDSRKAVDEVEARYAKAYADNLDWEDSDAMQARIDDEVIAEDSRKAVDEVEARYAKAYADNGDNTKAQELLDRIGK